MCLSVTFSWRLRYRCLELTSDLTSNQLFPFPFSIFEQTAGRFSGNVGWSVDTTEGLNTPVPESGMLTIGKSKFTDAFREGFWSINARLPHIFLTSSTLFTMTGNYRPLHPESWVWRGKPSGLTWSRNYCRRHVVPSRTEMESSMMRPTTWGVISNIATII